MAAFTRKQYAGAAVPTTTTTLLTDSGTSVTILSTTGWPSQAGVPFYVSIGAGSAFEEKCLATISGSTLTLTRAQDDTTAVAHAIGSSIYPVFTANDADEANELVSKLTTKGDLLVTDGNGLFRLGVGTDGFFLKANNSESVGLEWASIPTINSLDDVGDVTISTIEDGDFLKYNSSASAWINETVHFLTVSDTAPSDEVKEGDLWYNSNELEMYVRYSSTWQQITLTPEFPKVEELDNAYIDNPVENDVLAFDGADWYNAQISDIVNLLLSDISDINATAAEVNILDGATLITDELNILDGATLTTEELNILDGATITTSELNTLDGLTASTAELNILDGATISITELNYVDGVTSAIQTQLDNKASSTASPVITLAGDLSGSATFTNLGNATLTATIQANSVSLGTDTTGNYMSDLTQGTGVTITHTPGEGSNATIAIGQAVGTSSSVQFAAITAPLIGNSSTATTLQTARNIAGQSFNGSANISISPTDLTGVTSTAAEINILNGATLSTSELNYVDGVTSAIQTQLNDKAPLASPTFTGTVSGITKTMVGLGNVDNTADSAKPVSTTQQTALDLKANLASPALTGTPTAPTAAASTNTTQVATTAFVRAEVAALVGTAGATLDTLGELATALGNDANLSTTLTTSIGLKAPLASPTFTGTVTLPDNTVALGTKTTGDYVSSLVQGTGVTITNNTGESSTPTIAIGQAVSTSSSVTFAAVTASVIGNASTATTLQTARTITLDGDLSGSVSFNGSSNVTLTATVAADSVALGTDTTGNYMSDLTQGTGVTITHTPGEGSNATIAIGQAVGTSASVTFANVTATGNVAISGRIDKTTIRESVADTSVSASVVTADYATGDIFYVGTAPGSNFTVNLTNAPTDNGKAITVVIFVTQGATGYYPNVVQVAGSAQTIKWANGAAPTPTSSAGKIDIFSFTFVRRSAAWTVFGSSNLGY